MKNRVFKVLSIAFAASFVFASIPAANVYAEDVPAKQDAVNEKKAGTITKTYLNSNSNYTTNAMGALSSTVFYNFDSNTGTLTITGSGAMPDMSDDDEGEFDYNEDINHIVISEGITSIGNWDFFGCYNAETVSIPSTVTTIGHDAFKYCESLTDVSMAEGVTTIGESAFYGCTSLTTIYIPKSIKTIVEYAFDGCDSLGAVYYSGTPGDWSSISIEEDGNEPLISAAIYYQNSYFINPNNGSTYQFIDEGGKQVLYKDGQKDSDEFVCDGKYTYYCQADGTVMKDRLTYHPDGNPSHVIYFDSNGHEVFNAFSHVAKSIAGEPVDDYCYFDVNGFMYVNTVTYDQTGTKLYYINEYGQMQHDCWFTFSSTAKTGDTDTPWNLTGSHIGFAQYDGSLLINTTTSDWIDRTCYLQGNGEALY